MMGSMDVGRQIGAWPPMAGQQSSIFISFIFSMDFVLLTGLGLFRLFHLVCPFPIYDWTS
jgi:hypothetical protein